MNPPQWLWLAADPKDAGSIAGHNDHSNCCTLSPGLPALCYIGLPFHVLLMSVCGSDSDYGQCYSARRTTSLIEHAKGRGEEGRRAAVYTFATKISPVAIAVVSCYHPGAVFILFHTAFDSACAVYW